MAVIFPQSQSTERIKTGTIFNIKCIYKACGETCMACVMYMNHLVGVLTSVHRRPSTTLSSATLSGKKRKGNRATLHQLQFGPMEDEMGGWVSWEHFLTCSRNLCAHNVQNPRHKFWIKRIFDLLF